MTNRAFRDAALKENRTPNEMARAASTQRTVTLPRRSEALLIAEK